LADGRHRDTMHSTPKLSILLLTGFALALTACDQGAEPTSTHPVTADDALPDDGEDEGPLECSDTSQLAIYSHRIEPLLREDRPSSCNRCHLSGTHLNLFVTGSPCEAMTCLIGQELVDL